MSETADNVMSTIEGLAKRVEGILLKSKDSPQLLGIELISLGTILKVTNIDFIVWDFSGKHVPAPNLQAQNTPDPNAISPASPTPGALTPGKPTFWQQFMANLPGVEEFFLGTAFGLPTTVGAAGIQNSPVLQEAVGGLGNAAISTLPNLLGLLGITLPTQITLSELIIVSGTLLLMDPVIKAVSGSLSGLFSTATKALALG